MFMALMSKHDSIHVAYDFEQAKIVASIGHLQECIPFVGRIDKIRDSNLQDAVANISVHEAGHAVAYIVLFGLAPLQLKSKLASSYAGGFTFPHQIYETKDHLISKIKIFLAGGVAEEVVFGKSHASIGRSHDREQATVLAIDYVRKYGFDEEFQANYVMEYGYSMDKYATDTDIEKMLTRLVAETQELLSSHKSLLLELALQLSVLGSLEAKTVAEIATKYNVQVEVKEEGYLKVPAYHMLLDKK
jgi:ATP-dependent Zn protease